MKAYLSLISFLFSIQAFAFIAPQNAVWIDQDEQGRDQHLHISLTDANSLRSLSKVFLQEASQTPRKQSLSIQCKQQSCLISFFDQDRNYRKSSSENSTKTFTLNPDLALSLYEAWSIPSPVFFSSSLALPAETKIFRSTDIDLVQQHRVELKCVQTTDENNQWKPFCQLSYLAPN